MRLGGEGEALPLGTGIRSLERPQVKFLLRLLFISLLAGLAGCGSSSFEGEVTPPIAPFYPTVYRIGVLAPLDAGSVEFGRGIRNSVILAVERWNAQAQPFGPFFEVVAVDDSSDPNVGLANLPQLLNTPNLVGVVGTYNSGVATAVLPTLEAEGIPLLSPGNTDPALTLGPDSNNPSRPFDNYFRLVARDDLQGPALAEYAFSNLGVTRVAILTEEKEVSQTLASNFQTRFQALGGTITALEIAPEGTTDYSLLLGNLAATSPELLFYAGEVPSGSTVRDQATGAGLAVTLMGGDGLNAQSYIDDATVSTEGDVASAPGVAVELLPSGAEFLADYQSAGFAEPATFFGPYAFDAANLLIRATVQNGPESQSVLAFLEQVNTIGVTGQLAFDQFGDALNQAVTLYVVRADVFVPDEVVKP